MEIQDTSKMNGDSEPFSVRNFRKSLWNETEVIDAMQQFVKRSRNRLHEDVVLDFLKDPATSVDGTDFTRLLQEKIPIAQLMVVFNSLEAIFLRISDGLQAEYGQWTRVVVGQLLERGPIHNFIRGLTNTNNGATIVSTLRLLTTMITASPSSARTISASVKISTDHLRALLERSNRSNCGAIGESVRSAAIVYLMSFLMIDDNSLIRQYVDDNVALNSIFPSLVSDSVATIQIFLNTLLTKVAQNASISKTSKIRLFNFKNLRLILKLFQWKSRKLHNNNKKKKHSLSQAEQDAIGISDDNRTADEISVRQIAYQFLESICCSTEQGIRFIDRKFGITGENKNSEITKLLMSHIEPHNDPLIVKLFVSIIKASPDQLVHYVPMLYKNVTVRTSDSWIKTINCVRLILEAQQPMDVFRLAEQTLDYNKLVQIGIMVTTTSILNKDQLSIILNNEKMMVRHQGLLFLNTMLEKANCLMDENNLEFRDLFVKDDDIKQFVKLYTVELFNKLPSWQHLIKCWDLAFSSTKKSETIIQVPIAEHVDAIVNTVNYYFRVNQASVDQKIEFLTKNLLSNFAMFDKKLEDRDRVVKIQLMTLRLFESNMSGHLPSKILSNTNKSIVAVVCDIAAGCDFDLAVRHASCDLLRKLLLSTDIFKGVEHEIEIWTKAFPDSDETELSLFMSGALDDLIRNVDVLMDSLKVNRFKAIEPDTICINTCSYDELFNDIINEDDDVDCESIDLNHQVVDYTGLSFSPMVLAVLRRLESTGPACQKSVARLLIDIVHCQFDPEGLCHLIVQYSNFLPKKCIKYLKSFESTTEFIVSNSTVNWTKIIERRDLFALVKEVFRSRSAPVLTEAALECFLVDFTDDCRLCRQLLVYLQVIVNKKSPSEVNQVTDLFCNLLKTLMMKSTGNSVEIGNSILDHPVIQNSFLLDDLLQDSNVCTNVCKKLTELAIYTVGRHGHLKTSQLLIDKVYDFIFKKLELWKSNSGNESLMNCAVSIVDLVELFQEKFTSSNFNNMMTFLMTNFTPTMLLKKKKKCLNEIGLFLLRVLQVTTNRNELGFSVDNVTKLGDFHKEIIQHSRGTIVEFGQGLCILTEKTPMYCLVFNCDFFTFCLENGNSSNISLAEILMHYNVVNYYRYFEEWMATWTGDWSENRTLYSGLVGHYLKYIEGNGLLNNEDCSDRRIVIEKLSSVYWTLMTKAILDKDVNDVAASIVQSFVQLKVVSLKKRVKFSKRIVEFVEAKHLFPVPVLKVIDIVISTISKEDFENISPSIIFIKISLKLMVNIKSVFTAAIDDDDAGAAAAKQFNEICNLVTKTLNDKIGQPDEMTELYPSLQESKLLQSVIKLCLKIGLRDDKGVNILQFLKTLLECCFQFNEVIDLEQCCLVFEMIFGHSNFVPNMVTSTTSDNFNWKMCVLDLLVLLVKINPLVCKAVHVPILLAAYDGHLKPVDERLLRLLYQYELNGVDMHSYRPFVWGRPAQHHYSVLKHLGNCTLWKQPKMEDILGLLDKETMLRTALNFPLELELQVGNYFSNVQEFTSNRKDFIYDPRFLLPLFTHLLSPEALVHCTRFIDCNALAVAFASLGSYDEMTRSAGCYILNSFGYHLEGHSFRNSLVWIYLLNIVRNALKSDNQIPSLMVCFLTRTCQLLQYPTSVVAQPVFNYLFVHPYLDIEIVPEFYVLFSNSDVKHNVIRYWILSVLTDGLRTSTDFKLCQKLFVFKIIMNFMMSPLSNQMTKCKILGVVNAAVKIPSVTTHLITRQGLLAFVVAALRDYGDNNEILIVIMDIVSSAWTSVSKTMTMWTEFQLVLVRILICLDTSTTVPMFRDFLKIMASVLTKSANGTNAIGVPMTTIKKLLYIYDSMVKGRKATKLLSEDQSAIKDIENSIYKILMNWYDEQNHQKQQRLSNYLKILLSALNFLLKTFPICPENYDKLSIIYLWLSERLKCDHSGSLSKCLSGSSSVFLKILLKSYDHVLFERSVDDASKSDDVLIALNTSMIILTKNLIASEAICTPEVGVDVYQNVDINLVELVSKIRQFLNITQLDQLIDSMNNVDKKQTRFYAISFGLLVCELWIGKKNPRQYFHQIEASSETKTKQNTMKRKLDCTDESHLTPCGSTNNKQARV